VQGRSDVPKIGGVLSDLCRSSFQVPVPTNVQLQRSTKASRGSGGPPPQPTRGLGQRHISSPVGSGAKPSRKRFWGISCANLCIFTHLLVHLTAVWLAGLIFPFNYFGGVGHPQLEFLGVSGWTPTVAVPLLWCNDCVLAQHLPHCLKLTMCMIDRHQEM